MGPWDVRLLTAAVTDMDGEPVIELYGKTRDKESITLLSKGHRPYFFVVDPPANAESGLRGDAEILSTERDRLLLLGKEHEVLRITIKDPWEISKHRGKWMRAGYKVLSADIPFHHRVIYDLDMGACIRATGKIVEGKYATDLTVEMESFENIEPFDPGLRILSFDIENSIEHDFIYTICSVIGESGDIIQCESLTGTEKDIISKFADLIRREDPDVITGYNIDNYDIRKIMERAKACKMDDALPWGRDLSQPRLVSSRFWRVRGRIVCDAWWAARKELRPKQETLNAVSLQVLGESKLDVDPKHMDEEWKNDREKVIRYCFKDAELALRILLEVGTLRKGMDLAAVSKLPLEDVLTSGTSQLADSLLIRAADRNGVGVPMMGKRTADSEQIEGGYVHTMKPGLYHWVCVLDFKSMYPSLIIAKNICFTTLSPEGDIISPSGARFLSPEKRIGLLPMILSGLMQERDETKKRMKNAKNEHEHQYLDGLQAAVKVLMNTFYGLFASTFYRFTDRNIGSAITSFARKNVTSIISEVENEGIHVVYGDTDSVFMQSPENDLDGCIGFGNNMADRFSRDGGTLEFEKIMEPLFSHGKKKRYVGRVIWPDRSEELFIRGYELRRSDSFGLQDDMLTNLFEKILDEDEDGALALVKKTIQDTVSGNVEAEELVISKSCKDPRSYENPERMVNVQAAEKLMAMGYNFIPGMKVSFVVVDGDASPQKVEPYISGVPFTAKPDYKYYAQRLSQTASRITEVYGWSEKDLMLGSQQSTLFDSFSTPTPAPKEKKGSVPQKKAAPKPSSLDDFF